MKIKNLLSFVNKANEGIERLCHKKSVQLLVVACTVSALPLGWAYDHWNRMEGGRLDSLEQRLAVSFKAEGLKDFDGRIFRYGEYDNLLGALMTYGYTAALLGKPQLTLRNSVIRGFAAVDLKDNLMGTDEHSCIVSTIQHGQQDRFYQFSAFNYMVYDRDLVDFAVQTHEAMHCLINLDVVSPDYKDHVKHDYLVSVTEVASDLAAILDHMRLTGTDDLFHLFIKPFRLPAVTDLQHSTINALEHILKDIDPVSVTQASAGDIPRLVESLIHRHLYHPGVGYDIFKNPDLKGEQLTPAMRAILLEIRTKLHLSAGIEDQHTEGWRLRVAEALAVQLDNYKDELPAAYYDMVAANHKKLFEKYDVPDHEPVASMPRYNTETKMIKGRGMLDYYAPAL